MDVILNTHNVKTLKNEISKTNIKGYSKMNKSQLIQLMLKHETRFTHIKPAEKTKPKPVVEKPKPVGNKSFDKSQWKDIITDRVKRNNPNYSKKQVEEKVNSLLARVIDIRPKSSFMSDEEFNKKVKKVNQGLRNLKI